MTSVPAVPEPDDKDWTWTLEHACPECGFDASGVAVVNVPTLIVEFTAVLGVALRGPQASTRPAPAVWSPLEYGCHVRDVCILFEHRLKLMLTQDDPLFDNWDQDATALASRYWLEDPPKVASALDAAGASVAAEFGVVRGGQWQRPGRRSNGSMFTIETFARYFLHDLAHHAWDVTTP